MKTLPSILIPILLMGCSPSQSTMQNFADEYVKERQVKWHDRTEQAAAIVAGTQEGDVLKALGKPDSTSDSPTTKNWLYWSDPSIKGGQVCMNTLILKIEGGVVVERRQGEGLRQDIADFYHGKHP
ncbi:MAG: hypothetical protein KDK97_11395 [Verrucomicrobiales bacterium]|nr:hypothetical protein [Verrucomicrobiales bacterium]MCP5560640.1 hypothetical protein [Verrucomicrobiaceae bacterium]